MDLNMLVNRCLAYGIVVYPYQLYGVFDRYEKYKIPDDILGKLKKEDVKKYVDGLYKSSCEMANDWTEGHALLKELGFVEKVREDGHRRFISLEYATVQSQDIQPNEQDSFFET